CPGTCSALWRDQPLLSVLVGQLHGNGRPSRRYLNMGGVGFTAESQARAIFRGSEFHIRRPSGIDHAKENCFRVGRAVRLNGCRVKLDACSNSSLVVSDLEATTSKHRSDTVHLDRSRKKAKPQEAHLDLRQ